MWKFFYYSNTLYGEYMTRIDLDHSCNKYSNLIGY